MIILIILRYINLKLLQFPIAIRKCESCSLSARFLTTVLVVASSPKIFTGECEVCFIDYLCFPSPCWDIVTCCWYRISPSNLLCQRCGCGIDNMGNNINHMNNPLPFFISAPIWRYTRIYS